MPPTGTGKEQLLLQNLHVCMADFDVNLTLTASSL